MNNIIRRLKKKVLLKELEKWTDLMVKYNADIAHLDSTIDDLKDVTNKAEITRLKQLKNSYLDAYNNACMEAENIRKQLEAL